MEGRIYHNFCEECLDFTDQIAKNEDETTQTLICDQCKNKITQIRLDSFTNLRKGAYDSCQKKDLEDLEKKMNQKKNGI